MGAQERQQGKPWPEWLRVSNTVSILRHGSSEMRRGIFTERGYARGVVTPWGVHSVEITGPNDSAFSVPARLSISRKGNRYNVPGFLTCETDQNGTPTHMRFHGDASYVQLYPDLYRD